jgi:hypothetical protein
LLTPALRDASSTRAVPWTFTSMYSSGRSIDGTMSPMPAKWNT